jgi:hypothetical protein
MLGSLFTAENAESSEHRMKYPSQKGTQIILCVLCALGGE